MLKLGLGWLLGESGEIFKILDDPLGDRCHVSRYGPIPHPLTQAGLERSINTRGRALVPESHPS